MIIYSRSWKENLRHLALVLERLSLHGLTAALKKSRFGKTRLEYLGHIITAEKNEAKKEQVSTFLGIAPASTKSNSNSL